MDTRHANPFIESFTTVMPQLGFGDIQRGDLSVKGQEPIYPGVIIIVGIAGTIKGNVVCCINMEAARKTAFTMTMGIPVDTLGEMSWSALSELANMLTANVVISFLSAGITMDVSVPTLFYEENISVKMGPNQALCIQLFTDGYPIEIDIVFEN